MVSKAEARAQRKAERQRAFEESKASFLERIDVVSGPRIEHLPDHERLTPRAGVPPHLLVTPQQPKLGSGNGRFGYQMTWCIRKQDIIGVWSWGEPRAWSADEFAADIEPALKSLQGLPWEEIENQSSDGGHRLHHQHELADIVPEASRRWSQLGLEEFDTLFRFRMGNTRRAWGVVIRGHFFMVWWERHHNIYPV